MKNLIRLIVILFIPVFFSCEPNISEPQGTGNLGELVPAGSKVIYVAIGNSLTAGYQDGAVYAEGQQYSYPNLLAQQLGVEEFVQPSYDNPGMGERLYFKGISATGSPVIVKQMNIANVSNATWAKPYNNLGIPGAIAYDLLDESDFAVRATQRSNPFYMAVLRNPVFGKTIVDQAIALQPNFITLGMGNNDVLGYATSGGTVSTTGMPNNPVPTPADQMAQIYGGALTKLTASLPNTKILMFNIPNVLGTPFFKVIPWNALILDETNAAALNSVPAYKALGFTFKPGANGFIVESPKSPGGVRQMTNEDYLLLTCPQDSLKAGWGSKKPIPNKFVLDKFEAEIVLQAVTDYNTKIDIVAKGFTGKVWVMDMNKVFADVLLKGYAVPGSTTLRNTFISGEFFSLDGIHPNSRGYGAVANEIIKYINTTWKADIPLYPLQNLPAITVSK